MHNFNIRPGNENDADAILDIHRQAILKLGQAGYTSEECESWAAGLTPDRYKSAMTTGGESYLVIEDASKLLGFCSFKDNEIIGLYVDPTASRSGIGSKLLAAAENAIVNGRHKTIILNAALSAVQFYQFRDYEILRKRPWKTRGGLEIFICEMKKDIS